MKPNNAVTRAGDGVRTEQLALLKAKFGLDGAIARLVCNLVFGEPHDGGDHE